MKPLGLLIVIVYAFAVDAHVQKTLKPVQPVKVLALQSKTHHVQGIDTDGVHLWVTSVDRETRKGWLQEFKVIDGTLERSVELQDGVRFHPGGIAADGDSIWIPVAEYRRDSTATIQRRNKKTLALESQFAVPDHIGCIAVTPDFLIGGNWDSRDFYIWDYAGKLKRKVPVTTGNGYQDLKFRDRSVIGSGLLPGNRAAVDWLDFPGFRVIKRLELGNTDRSKPFTQEGMTEFQNQLWLLPEDGNSRLFIFDLPK